MVKTSASNKQDSNILHDRQQVADTDRNAGELGLAAGDEPVADWQLEAAIDVLDKQYRLYSWNDQKTATLITANSVLVATIGFLFSTVTKDSWALLFAIVALVLLAISLILSLAQVAPQGSSGKSGRLANLRSLRGIASFDNWQAYHQACRTMTKNEFYRDCIRQVYGMTVNNDESRDKTRRGVHMTLVAIGFIIFAAVKVSVPSLPPFIAAIVQPKSDVAITEQPTTTATDHSITGPETVLDEAIEQMRSQPVEEPVTISKGASEKSAEGLTKAPVPETE